MNKLFIYFCFVLHCTGAVYAQTTANDCREKARWCLQQNQVREALHYFKQEWSLRGKSRVDSATLKVCYNIAEIYRAVARYDSAQVWALHSQQLHQQFYGADDAETLDADLFLAQMYYLQKQYNAANTIISGFNEKEKRIKRFSSDWQAKWRILAASIAAEIGEIERALRQYEQALTYAQTPDMQARVYNNIASLKSNRYQYLEALSVYEKALQLRKEHLGEQHLNTAAIYQNQAAVYLNLQQPDKAKKCIWQALSIYNRIYGNTHPTIAESYLHLSAAARQNNQIDSAQQYNQQALDIYQKILPSGSPQQVYALLCKARLYRSDRHFDKAEKYYTQAVTMQQKITGNTNHPDVLTAFMELGEMAQMQNNWQLALQYLQKALHNAPNNNYHERAENATIPDFLTAKTQYQQAFCYYQLFLQTKNKDHFRLALLATTKAQRILSQRSSIALRFDQTNFMELQQKTAELGLALQQQNPDGADITRVFELMENNKSLQLLDKWAQNSSNTELTDVQNALWQTEMLYQKQRQTTDTASLSLIFQQLFLLRKKRDSLYNKYPLQTKNNVTENITNIDFAKAQQLLDSDEGVLEYFWGEESLYLLFYTRQNAIFKKIEKSENFLSDLRDFWARATGNTMDIEDLEVDAQHFAAVAYRLYEQLIPLEIPPNIKRLTIVADGDLAQIPFEVLLSELPTRNNYLTFPYTLRLWAINYAYSIAVLAIQQQQAYASETPFSVFAMEANNTAQPLRGAKAEVDWLQSHFGGVYKRGEDATTSAFKQYAPQHSIVHLATHGYVPPDNPLDAQLLLSDAALRLDEVAVMPLRAALVVLSACYTGKGQWQTGEGTMSLARGFVYAGASSVVFSLWQMHDQCGVSVIKRFYERLTQGVPKDEALRLAKLDFLDKDASQISAHPSFWAAMVQSGNRAPVALASNRQQWASGIYWWGGGLLPLLWWGWGRVRDRSGRPA